MTEPKTNTDRIQTSVRLSAQLYRKIEIAAERNGRSINAEIVARLSSSALDDNVAAIGNDTAELKALSLEILRTLKSRPA